VRSPMRRVNYIREEVSSRRAYKKGRKGTDDVMKRSGKQEGNKKKTDRGN